MKFPCMKIKILPKIFISENSMHEMCAAQFPMNISWAKKSSQSQRFHYHAWKYDNGIFMIEVFMP